MTPPSRDQIEQMAFMAMMDGIIHTSVPCNCASCKSDNKPRTGVRSQQVKRSGADSNQDPKPASKPESSGTCNHNHSHNHNHNHTSPELRSSQPSKKSTPIPSQNKNSQTLPSNLGRSDKVNALLKADSIQAVFDVLNLTNTTKDEKDLATKIQNVTKDCKLYQETKDKIVELCDEEDDFDPVFGLLAKFRYERNMLTTAVIKGNSEREKALLCIQRVDHLMYMLQDVAKKKDSKGNDVMHKLGDIIVEIHDLAKTPSTLYDEFLDIKEEHFDLLNDHEEMHQKFVDVNSCHEKLHTSHDKLQTEHHKLLKDLAEARKRAGMVGALKNDIMRLEKASDKTNNDNFELKKEVERLNAELAKVNALKHENAQLKKKVTTLSTQPIPAEEPQSLQMQAAKKKKGKKGLNEGPVPKGVTPEQVPEPISNSNIRTNDNDRAHEEQITKFKKSQDVLSQELEVVRLNLKQLNTMVRNAESARDQALEKLEVEKATSQNWKDIATGNSNERDRLKVEVNRHTTRAAKLQSIVQGLEQSLNGTKVQLAEQIEAHRQAKEELDQRPPTPAVSIASHQPTSLNPETIRLLRKIRSETSQLARDLDDSRSSGIDLITLLDHVQFAVRRVVTEVERDIEEILSVRGSDPPISHQSAVPEAVLPFAYNTNLSRQTPQFPPHPSYSPAQESPQIPSSTSLPPFRPMMPPPGFSESSSSPFSHNHDQYQYPNQSFSRNLDSPLAPFSRIAEPPGLTANLGFSRTIEPPSASSIRYGPLAAPSSSSLHSHSPLHNSSASTLPNSDVGVIGSRSTSSKLNTSPSPASTPAPSVGSGTAPAGALGNGAVGVDWNMWARNGR